MDTSKKMMKDTSKKKNVIFSYQKQKSSGLYTGAFLFQHFFLLRVFLIKAIFGGKLTLCSHRSFPFTTQV